MEFLTLGKVIKLLRERNINIKKNLGQNFLIDRNARDKILSYADIGPEDTVVEVGSGLGSLTDILADRAKEVYAFEVDAELCALLRERFASMGGFHLIEGDFLAIGESWWENLPSKVKFISNTPYYVSSQIAFNLIKFRRKIKFALLTVQKEVGEKITGAPGHKNYGPVSVLYHIYTDSKICYSLKKEVFFPKPEVNSVVLRVEPLEMPKIHIKEEKLFLDFLHDIFMCRRKKLANVVDKIFGIDKGLFKKAAEGKNISPDMRAEALNPQEIYEVFKIVKLLAGKEAGR